MFGKIGATVRKVRGVSDKFRKFCIDKNGRFWEISGSNIYRDYPGSWPPSDLTFTMPSECEVFSGGSQGALAYHPSARQMRFGTKIWVSRRYGKVIQTN